MWSIDADGGGQGAQPEIVSPGQCAIDSTIISNFSDISELNINFQVL